MNVKLIRDVETNSQMLDRIAARFWTGGRLWCFLVRRSWLYAEGGRYELDTCHWRWNPILIFLLIRSLKWGPIITGDGHKRWDMIHANHIDMVKLSEATHRQRPAEGSAFGNTTETKQNDMYFKLY